MVSLNLKSNVLLKTEITEKSSLFKLLHESNQNLDPNLALPIDLLNLIVEYFNYGEIKVLPNLEGTTNQGDKKNEDVYLALILIFFNLKDNLDDKTLQFFSEIFHIYMTTPLRFQKIIQNLPPGLTLKFASNSSPIPFTIEGP
jgi:hypothetical protein